MASCINCERERNQEWLYCPWCGEKISFKFPASRPSIDKEDARKAMGLKGTVFEGKNLFEIWEQVKRIHPNHIVLIEDGYMWKLFSEDATLMAGIFEWKTFDDRAGVTKTGFPLNGKRPIEALEEAGYAYMKLERPDRDPHRRPYRVVAEVFPIGE